MGSNMAECHPVAYRWPMKAKMNGAKLIHIDPRFTRTSATCDLHVPLRAGSDIAFLGALVNHVINSERWNTEPFFREYVVNYTNAATIIDPEFQDTEDLNGVFSGLMEYTGGVENWPYNGFIGQYEDTSWQYARMGGSGANMEGRASAAAAKSGEQAAGNQSPAVSGGDGRVGGSSVPPEGWDALVRSLRKPSELRDPTLQDPRCVFQILRRHFIRYTPEMVEQVCGSPREKFMEVAQSLLDNSGPDRTSAFAYAVAWTQHTYGVQIIGCAALLQLLLGNFGRPGGGILALRGHAAIQGSTDVPTLYHSIHGYMSAPSALKGHGTLRSYMEAEVTPTGYWANMPKFMVSYLKSMYGDAATAENDYGYDWHPKILGDHSHMAFFAAAAEGRLKGGFIVGQNPATSLNALVEREGLRKLDWLVVKDNWLTESATYWYTAPEVRDGTHKVEDNQTEVFFFPSTQIAEYEGSLTNTQRMLQWHFKASDPPGDCRTDTWFYYQLGKRLKAMYADSALARDAAMQHLTWEFEPDEPISPPGEPSALKILREINGYQTADPSQHLPGFAALKDDGSTTCASWIYCGCYPAPGRNLTAAKQPDAPGDPGAHLGWGWAWPANRRVLYNRASANLAGDPWSERKRWVWWDGSERRWMGYDVPDFGATKAPNAPADPNAIGLDALSGTDAFIMKADGKGWLYVPSGLVDGPLPTHYEPVESPVRNPLYPQQQNSPVFKRWLENHAGNQLATVGDPRFPHVITTYRLTEHYLAGGMSRWLPWLAELQPELFIELGTALAAEKGIRNLDRVRISSPRGVIRAKALVTNRIGVMQIAGKPLHHVGMPWHWGWMGLSTGDVVNTLTSLVGDPNVSMHEGKAFVCNVEKD